MIELDWYRPPRPIEGVLGHTAHELHVGAQGVERIEAHADHVLVTMAASYGGRKLIVHSSGGYGLVRAGGKK